MPWVILEFSDRLKAKWVTDGHGGERLNLSGSWRPAKLAANCHSAAVPGGTARELILISNIQLFTQKKLDSTLFSDVVK